MNEDSLNLKLRDFISSAIRNLGGRNYNEAVNDLKAALVLDKNNPEILYNLGIAHSRMGLHRTAIENFKALLSIGGGFVDEANLKKLMAFCYISLNDFSPAIIFLDDVLKFHHADTVALNMKAYCHERNGNLKEAEKIYASIIEIETENYTACNSLAYIMAKSGNNLDAALSLAMKASSHNKKNGAYLDTLGYVYFRKGDIEKALKLFKHAKARLPFSAEIDEHVREAEKISSILRAK